MRLSELAALLTGATIDGDGALDIRNAQVDSRLVQPGDLFICLPGATVDGHDFVEQAVEHGAVAVVVERPVQVSATKLIVQDVRFAMAIIACHLFAYPSTHLKVIGVTGTNGKTTTTYLLEQILRDAGFRTGLMGTIGVRIGEQMVEAKNTTQDALELQRSFKRMVEAGTDYALIEVSSHALEMGRVKGVHFRSALFTNLTQDHLDYHGTMEAYQAAKRLLFSRMNNGYEADERRRQYAIINMDDAAGIDYASASPAHVITYAITKQADVRATQIRISAQGTRFVCETYAGTVEMNLKMIGTFNVYNALAATATCLAEGVPLTAIAKSLAAIEGVDGRFEPVDEGQAFTVLVDYAHTPDSLQNVLSTIREFVDGRLVCVFGCGGNRDRTKRPLMAAIAAQYSDFVIATSDNPRFEEPEDILRDVEQGLLGSTTSYELIVDRQEAISRAIEWAQAGDVILLAGKGHETYQEIRGTRLPCDDRVLARAALARRSGMK